MNSDDFEDVEDLELGEVFEIEDWNIDECLSLPTLDDSKTDISKIIAVLSHNLNSREQLSIHKYYNDAKSPKKNSMKYIISILVKILLDNNIELTNFTINYFFDTIKLKLKKIEKSENKKEEPLFKYKNDFLPYINSWLLIIRSFIINPNKRLLLHSNKNYDYNLDQIVKEYNNDFWSKKLLFLKNIIVNIIMNIFTFNNKMYITHNKHKNIIKSNLAIYQQIDNNIIIILFMLFHYGLYIQNDYNKKKLQMSHRDFGDIMKYIHKIKKYFEVKNLKNELDEFVSKTYYIDIFYLILKDIPSKNYKIKIIKAFLTLLDNDDE